MPWPCRLIEVEKLEHPCGCSDPECKGTWTQWVDKATHLRPTPGDMFFAPFLVDREPPESWAPRYLALSEPRRAPIVVVTPDKRWWVLDQRAYNHANGGWYGDGWGMSGAAPAITMSPSINMVGSYHGWLQNGVLTDDCEGRSFPNA